MDKINKYRNKIIIQTGGLSEYGIKNYIESLSKNTKFDLEQFEEVLSRLENMFNFNSGICSSNKNKNQYSAEIQCNDSEKYINLYKRLIHYVKPKWMYPNCESSNGQCRTFNSELRRIAPNLYNENTQNGSSSINFLYDYYSNK